MRYAYLIFLFLSKSAVAQFFGAAPKIIPDTINTNIADSTNSNGITGKLNLSNWNDWSVPISGTSGNTGVYSAPLKDYAGITTTVQIRFNNSNFFVNNYATVNNWNSSTTAGPPLMFENGVINTTSSDTCNIKGIPAGKKVDIIWYAGRYSTSTRRQTITDIASSATSGSQLVTSTTGVDGKLEIDNLTPSSGKINLLISDDTGFWFCDAITLRIHSEIGWWPTVLFFTMLFGCVSLKQIKRVFMKLLIFCLLSILSISVRAQVSTMLPSRYVWDSFHVLTPTIEPDINHNYIVRTYLGDSTTGWKPTYLTHNLKTGLTVWGGSYRWASHYQNAAAAVADWNKMLSDHGKE